MSGTLGGLILMIHSKSSERSDIEIRQYLLAVSKIFLLHYSIVLANMQGTETLFSKIF